MIRVMRLSLFNFCIAERIKSKRKMLITCLFIVFIHLLVITLKYKRLSYTLTADAPKKCTLSCADPLLLSLSICFVQFFYLVPLRAPFKVFSVRASFAVCIYIYTYLVKFLFSAFNWWSTFCFKKVIYMHNLKPLVSLPQQWIKSDEM